MGRKKYTDPKFKKKFSDLYRGIPTEEIAHEILHVREATINDWKKGISFPDVGTLIAISKDRKVSLDYLLGDAPHSLNSDYKSAVVTTGLSEKTITALKEWFDGYGVIMLNRFIESGHYEALMIDLVKGIRVSQFYGNDEKDIPTKDDWIGYYSKEMGSVLNAFMYDTLKDLAESQLAEKILAKATEILTSMTPEQRKAKMDIMGSEFFFEKLFEQVDKELDEEV